MNFKLGSHALLTLLSLTMLVKVDQEVLSRLELVRELLGSDLDEGAFLGLVYGVRFHLSYSGNLNDLFQTQTWLPEFFRNREEPYTISISSSNYADRNMATAMLANCPYIFKRYVIKNIMD